LKKKLKFFSYLYPVRVQIFESEVSGCLEIFWENGKKVLNGPHSNYSFGRLHQVFASGFRHFKPYWEEIHEVLILGYGGGSISELLKKQRGFNGNITAVELDPVIREIAETHFPEALAGVELHIQDASRFLESTARGYDLIVVDLFIDDQVPAQFGQEAFIKSLQTHLNRGGMLIHNFMFVQLQERQRVMDLYRENFERVDFMELFGSNTLVWACKG
tara:strand:+ start:1846 stop:2496 length:651 start_codon:yes stop_codon:yes gene_type:complete